MDLIITILVSVVVLVYKKTIGAHDEYVYTSVVTDSGVVKECKVKESSLVVGKNLMLRKEPRAFHKILDDLGLS